MSAFHVHVVLVVLAAVLLRGLISLHPYSGAGKAPMFGDYEAQRHWMEITYHLPVQEWYVNSTDNDLMYWGLDYPPLTAYHSWICGAIQQKLNSSWIELFKSRGHESYDHKVFMRYSVMAVDVLVYIPAVLAYFFFCTRESGISTDAKLVFSLVALLYPGLVLIDHGHFQYNCVSLGLALWGVVGICSGRDLLGAGAFTLALNYKQMELYHALPFFCYLLGTCLWSQPGARSNYVARFWKLFKVAAVVIAVFVACWWPFLKAGDTALPLQVLRRLFPFGRGLYEDKVANVWCSLSIVVKLKEIFQVSTLINICLVSTMLALLPSSIDLLLRPTTSKFKYALVNSSLVFFLLSFHVHEKSILLAALPVCLLLPQQPLIAIWFLIVSTFSMTPLLIKDGLVVAFIPSLILFYVMADVLLDQLHLADRVLLRPASSSTSLPGRTDRPVSSPPLERDKPVSHGRSRGGSSRTDGGSVPEIVVEPMRIHTNRSLSILFGISVAGMALIFVASLVVRPPPRLPDLFSVLVSVYSCAHFLFFLLYFHWAQFQSDHGSKPIEGAERLNGNERKGFGSTTDCAVDGRVRKQKSKLKSH